MCDAYGSTVKNRQWCLKNSNEEKELDSWLMHWMWMTLSLLLLAAHLGIGFSPPRWGNMAFFSNDLVFFFGVYECVWRTIFHIIIGVWNCKTDSIITNFKYVFYFFRVIRKRGPDKHQKGPALSLIKGKTFCQGEKVFKKVKKC